MSFTPPIPAKREQKSFLKKAAAFAWKITVCGLVFRIFVSGSEIKIIHEVPNIWGTGVPVSLEISGPYKGRIHTDQEIYNPYNLYR